MSDFKVASIWVAILLVVFFVIVISIKAPVAVAPIAVSADDGRTRQIGSNIEVYEGANVCVYTSGWHRAISVIPKPAGGCE